MVRVCGETWKSFRLLWRMRKAAHCCSGRDPTCHWADFLTGFEPNGPPSLSEPQTSEKCFPTTLSQKETILLLDSSSAPTFIESFFVVRGSEDCKVGPSGSQRLVPGVSRQEARLASRPTSVSSAPSSRLTSCAQSICAALAVPISCVGY